MTAPIAPIKITSGDQKKLYTSSRSAEINNTPRKNIKEIIPDSRFFVRPPLDHEWRNLSPAGQREIIVKHLAVSPDSIGLTKTVCTCFSISPYSSGARGALLRTNIGLLDTGVKLEPASNWAPLLVPTVPKLICTIQVQTEVTKEMLASEIECVTSIHPTFVRYYGSSMNPGELLYSKRRRQLTFASDVMDIIRQEIAHVHPHVETMGRVCTHKKIVKHLEIVKTMEATTNFWPAPLILLSNTISAMESIVISNSQSPGLSNSDSQQPPIEAPLDEQMQL
ncbi:hypothetical protein EPUL_005717 [Erysiphe pulchra]|uniref:Uncharacterized protein n=1 Tax=Erysiphe pulchra TaxID=225359 RepID=A0A2S4PPK9_9PEZI|nr:hypothetical protein EPUL_005717 [Erysiphe pulchra]